VSRSGVDYTIVLALSLFGRRKNTADRHARLAWRLTCPDGVFIWPDLLVAIYIECRKSPGCEIRVTAGRGLIFAVAPYIWNGIWGRTRMREDQQTRYWRRNLRYLGVLLTIWFVVSYGFGILFVEQLDRIRIGGFKLGFWFAQQGSIYVFVILIFVYVALMNRLDRSFLVREDQGVDS
jgi:putative solute:sodium symporter small subunit